VPHLVDHMHDPNTGIGMSSGQDAALMIESNRRTNQRAYGLAPTLVAKSHSAANTGGLTGARINVDTAAASRNWCSRRGQWRLVHDPLD
jgi:hypothetical protein